MTISFINAEQAFSDYTMGLNNIFCGLSMYNAILGLKHPSIF